MKLVLTIISCKNLIIGDLINGLADPYVIATINAPAKEISEEEVLFPSPSAVVRTHSTLSSSLISSHDPMNASSSSLPRNSMHINTSHVSSSSTSSTPLTPRTLQQVTGRKSFAKPSPLSITSSVSGPLSATPYYTSSPSPSTTTSDISNKELTREESVALSSDYTNKAPCEFKNRKIIAQKKTEVMYSTLDPVYSNEQLVVENIKNESILKDWLITLEVYDYDYMKYDDYLGSVEIPIEKYQLQPLQPMIITVPLEGVPHGEITFDLNLCEESQVFGVELEKVMSRHREKLHGHGLPKVVVDMFNFLSEDLSVTDEGIFRIPGKSDLIVSLKKLYDKCEDRVVRNFILEQEKALIQENESGRAPGMVKVVASLLKEYIRTLPNPLLTYALYDDFVSLATEKKTDEGLLSLVMKLPPLHQHLLYWLLALMTLIASKHEKNKMTAVNLASVVGINILKKKDDKKQAASLESARSEADRIIRCFECLINNYSVLLPHFEKNFTFYK